ncbi:MAG: Hsp70 family protein [Anaerolineae bacterium]|nr:Hsp70 family protein [Anaerolineae bacterium]
MIVGMDFGTTNSGMALYDGQTVKVLPLDPANTNPRVLPTAIYVTNEQGIVIGRAAIDRYYSDNIGRPVKLRKVWIGEMEIFGGDMYYVTDAYAFVDVLSPGRLFLSVKTSLRDESYPGTVVGQFYYSLENLIALFLSTVKIRAEQMVGQELKRIVLGRPVRFARDPEHDRLAQARLLQAAFHAGYEKVYFQYEPIAAAYSYETTIDKPENVLIFDFGGGTLDITVMRLGEPGNRKVLATGGIPVAGDVFDQKLVRAKLPKHFGEGTQYGDRRKALTMPQWIYDSFSDWQKLLELQSAENRRILEDIARTARHRYQIEMLLALVSSNYGLKMFDVMEESKRVLSQKRGTEILLEGPDFHVRDFVTRTEFEAIIRPEIRAIEDHLLETVQASGLEPGDIDAVIRTGGSSQIPVFHEMLFRLFGADKVRAIDTFSSVTAGLGVIAHGIEKGEIDAVGYTPADLAKLAQPGSHQPNVPAINLELLQRRIVLDEGAVDSVAEDSASLESGQALVFVEEDGGITAVSNTLSQGGKVAEWQGGRVTAVLATDFDEQQLMITTHYRFLLATPRQLADWQRLGLKLGDMHKLEREERVCALANWTAVSKQPKLLLVTSAGVARPYPINVLAASIQAPVPFKFDHPLDGIVVAALGMAEPDDVVITTRTGRAVRWSASALRTSGTQAINLGDDRVTGAVLAGTADSLLLVTADGYGRRLAAEVVFAPEKPNQKGKSLVARRGDVVGTAVYAENTAYWAVTSSHLLPLAPAALPITDSTKTQTLLTLPDTETITGIFNL